MTIEVIGAGFGRTGTLSIKVALEMLGYYKCHHMEDLFGSRDQVDYWESIAHGCVPDWDTFFSGYKACVDFPASIFYQELMGKYPDAKIILSIRSDEGWYKSTADTIYKASQFMPSWFHLIAPDLHRTVGLIDTLIWNGLFKRRFEDEAFAKQVFLLHIERVKASVPPEKLLVFEVREGWGPLCAFLGKPEPDRAFPHLNDTATFNRKIHMMALVSVVPLVLTGAVIVAIGSYFAFK